MVFEAVDILVVIIKPYNRGKINQQAVCRELCGKT